jgi:hypothetical protein
METITGTLHVLRLKKHRQFGSSLGSLFAAAIETSLAAKGKITLPEYPPDYYITIGKKVGFNGTEGNFDFVYKFKGRPKAFSKEMEGWSVVIRGHVEPFGNGLGAYVTRYKILSVIPPPDSPAGKFAKFLVDNSESTGVPGLFELKPKENAAGGND